MFHFVLIGLKMHFVLAFTSSNCTFEPWPHLSGPSIKRRRYGNHPWYCIVCTGCVHLCQDHARGFRSPLFPAFHHVQHRQQKAETTAHVSPARPSLSGQNVSQFARGVPAPPAPRRLTSRKPITLESTPPWHN